MNSIIQRFVRASDLTPEQTWQLVMWCAERGGDEFSVRLLRSGDQLASAHSRFRDTLAEFHRGKASRESVTNQVGTKSRNSTEIWQCCPESIEKLRKFFPDGVLVAPSYAKEGWFEDFIIYRRGEIMCGVVSHEEIALLHLADREYRELSERRIKSHEAAT
jgi:hypothetical protein